MTADVTNVACAYINEAKKFIDSLRFGIECYDEDKLYRLELDYFLIKNPCDSVKWCYNFLAEEPDCSQTINCVMTLEVNTPTFECTSMSLTLLN